MNVNVPVFAFKVLTNEQFDRIFKSERHIQEWEYRWDLNYLDLLLPLRIGEA